MRSLLLSLISCLGLLGACNSPIKPASADLEPRNRAEPISDEEWQTARPKKPRGEAMEARYIDYRSGRVLGLVNESHTDTDELYSKRRKLKDSLTKVGSDEVLGALEERLTEQGFFKYARSGPAPIEGTGQLTTALEFSRGGRVSHIGSTGAGSESERKAYLNCVNDFIQLYTNILQLQSVDGAPGWENKDYAKPAQPGIKPRQP